MNHQSRRPPRHGDVEAYEYGVPRALRDSGGSARVQQINDVVLERLRDQFSPGREMEFVKAGSNRERVWQNETRHARRNMVNVRDGRMNPKRIHGVWEISKKGLDWLTAHPNPPRLGPDPKSVITDLSDEEVTARSRW
jgi:hypothetical protein